MGFGLALRNTSPHHPDISLLVGCTRPAEAVLLSWPHAWPLTCPLFSSCPWPCNWEITLRICSWFPMLFKMSLDEEYDFICCDWILEFVCHNVWQKFKRGVQLDQGIQDLINGQAFSLHHVLWKCWMPSVMNTPDTRKLLNNTTSVYY